jgi:kinesin family protein 4/21/27
METLNTLKYANRARNIKNKVTVNQDKNSAQIAALNKRIQELELQIQEFTSGRVVMTGDGGLGVSDLANENVLLKAENERLVLRIKSMQSLLDSQNERLARLQSEKDLMAIDHQEDERATGQVVSNDSGQSHVQSVIQEYIQQIEDLRSQLYLSQSHERGVASRHQMNRFDSTNSTIGSSMARQRSQVYPETEATELLQTARDDIGKLEEQLVKWLDAL